MVTMAMAAGIDNEHTKAITRAIANMVGSDTG